MSESTKNAAHRRVREVRSRPIDVYKRLPIARLAPNTNDYEFVEETGVVRCPKSELEAGAVGSSKGSKRLNIPTPIFRQVEDYEANAKRTGMPRGPFVRGERPPRALSLGRVSSAPRHTFLRGKAADGKGGGASAAAAAAALVSSQQQQQQLSASRRSSAAKGGSGDVDALRHDQSVLEASREIEYVLGVEDEEWLRKSFRAEVHKVVVSQKPNPPDMPKRSDSSNTVSTRRNGAAEKKSAIDEARTKACVEAFTPDLLESLIDALEIASGFDGVAGVQTAVESLQSTQPPCGGGVGENMAVSQSIATACGPVVHAYWIRKRSDIGKPLLRRFWPKTAPTDTNPHCVFRPREKERYKLRKHRKNDLDAFRKLQQLRRDFETTRELCSLVTRRERIKRLKLDVDRGHLRRDLALLAEKHAVPFALVEKNDAADVVFADAPVDFSLPVPEADKVPLLRLLAPAVTPPTNLSPPRKAEAAASAAETDLKADDAPAVMAPTAAADATKASAKVSSAPPSPQKAEEQPSATKKEVAVVENGDKKDRKRKRSGDEPKKVEDEPKKVENDPHQQVQQDASGVVVRFSTALLELLRQRLALSALVKPQPVYAESADGDFANPSDDLAHLSTNKGETVQRKRQRKKARKFADDDGHAKSNDAKKSQHQQQQGQSGPGSSRPCVPSRGFMDTGWWMRDLDEATLAPHRSNVGVLSVVFQTEKDNVSGWVSRRRRRARYARGGRIVFDGYDIHRTPPVSSSANSNTAGSSTVAQQRPSSEEGNSQAATSSQQTNGSNNGRVPSVQQRHRDTALRTSAPERQTRLVTYAAHARLFPDDDDSHNYTAANPDDNGQSDDIPVDLDRYRRDHNLEDYYPDDDDLLSEDDDDDDDAPRIQGNKPLDPFDAPPRSLSTPLWRTVTDGSIAGRLAAQPSPRVRVMPLSRLAQIAALSDSEDEVWHSSHFSS